MVQLCYDNFLYSLATPMKKPPNAEFSGTIDRKEDRYFVLAFVDGQELSVPVHYFARNAREGDVIHLRFLTDKQARADRAELARSLLEEILNGN